MKLRSSPSESWIIEVILLTRAVIWWAKQFCTPHTFDQMSLFRGFLPSLVSELKTHRPWRWESLKRISDISPPECLKDWTSGRPPYHSLRCHISSLFRLSPELLNHNWCACKWFALCSVKFFQVFFSKCSIYGAFSRLTCSTISKQKEVLINS